MMVASGSCKKFSFVHVTDRRPDSNGTRQVKVEPFAQQKQQCRPLAETDLERRGTIREADGEPKHSRFQKRISR